MMSVIDEIKILDMKVDEKFCQPSLIEAQKLYHSMVKNKVFEPRENQLNASGLIKRIVLFNSK